MVRYRIRMFGSRMVVLIAKPGRLAVTAPCVFTGTPHGGGHDAAATAATRLTRTLLGQLGANALAPVAQPLG